MQPHKMFYGLYKRDEHFRLMHTLKDLTFATLKKKSLH